jgi:putative ABC transport system permease protein
MLLSKPGFTAAAVLVLALGIGANSAVFSLVNAFLLKPLYAYKPEQLTGLYSRDTKHPDAYRAFSYPNYVDIREHNNTFSGLAALNVAMVGIQEGGSTRRALATIVSSNYFSTLGVAPLKGRAFLPEEEKPQGALSAIVTYPFWEKEGADPNLLGKPVRINGHLFTIVGIMPKGFTGTTALVSTEIFVPLSAYGMVMNDFDGRVKPLEARDNHALILLGRLNPGVTPQQADAALGVIAAQMEKAYPAENKDQALLVRPLTRMGISTGPQTDSAVRVPAIMLLSLAAVVLLIASLNLANMMMAKGTARRKEIAIRLAIGGSRPRRNAARDTRRSRGPGVCVLEHHAADSIDVPARALGYRLRFRAGHSRGELHTVVLRAEHRGLRAVSSLETLPPRRVDRPQGKCRRRRGRPQTPPVFARQYAGDGPTLAIADDADRGRPVRP